MRPDTCIHLVLRLRGGGPGAAGPDGEDAQRLDFVRFNRDGTTTLVKPPYTLSSQMKAIFFNSYAHLLVFFIPAGFAVYYCYVNQMCGVHNQLSRHYTECN